MPITPRALNLDDLRDRARRRLPRMVFEFIDGGAEDETTVRANRHAFDDLAFRPRVLVDVSRRSQDVTLLGRSLSTPVLLAPTGLSRVAGRDGELAAARAATACGTLSVVSTAASVTLEDVAAAAGEPQWFQLYPWGDRAVTTALIERAQRLGYTAMVITADVPITGGRERDQRTGMTVPPRVTPRTGYDVARRPRWLAELLTGPPITFANLVELFPHLGSSASSLAQQSLKLLSPAHTWADLAWMKEVWGGPTLLKGVMCAEDAVLAVEHGCDGVIVSNHGGRQCDHLPATIDVLPEVVAAVDGRAEVLLDGGVRRGSDVVKALALGARACLIGRPWLYGLATAGEAGVVQALEMLRTEIDRTLALVGRPAIGDLDPTVLRRRRGSGWE